MAASRGRPGRPPKSEARDIRGAILDAALTLFAKHGYDATSIRQIADAVGVTNPALYVHFDSKRAIFAELMRRGGPPVATKVIEELSQRDLSPREFIVQAVRSVWRQWDTDNHRRFLSVALREGLQAEAGDPPQIAAAAADVTDRLGPIFDTWMASGIAKRQEVDGRHIAFELFGMVALIRILHLNESSTPAHRKRGRQLVEQHLTFFCDAVLAHDR